MEVLFDEAPVAPFVHAQHLPACCHDMTCNLGDESLFKPVITYDIFG